MKPLSTDTSLAAEAVQVEACRRMTPTEKLRRVCELNAAVYGLAEGRIRKWYGEISEKELSLRLAALRLDRTTLVRLFGWDPEEKGY